MRFLIKKVANTPPEPLEKFENEHLTIVPVETYQADEIKRIRNSTSLTQRSFAECMGVSPKTVEAVGSRAKPAGGRSVQIVVADESGPGIPTKGRDHTSIMASYHLNRAKEKCGQ
ncbi:MAG: helix-turn-helix domain-containing protein [Dysosmobacter sp.]